MASDTRPAPLATAAKISAMDLVDQCLGWRTPAKGWSEVNKNGRTRRLVRRLREAMARLSATPLLCIKAKLVSMQPVSTNSIPISARMPDQYSMMLAESTDTIDWKHKAFVAPSAENRG